MNIVDLVLATHDLLDGAGIAHAFGGALALAYYSDPRATMDVDVNVFVPHDQAAEVVDRFRVLGLAPEVEPERWSPIAGVRLVAAEGRATLDLFFSLDERYATIAARIQVFPFGAAGIELPFLSGEDLVVFKLSFGRDRDWVDLARMAAYGTVIDMAYVEDTLIALRGPTLYPRIARARTLFCNA